MACEFSCPDPFRLIRYFCCWFEPKDPNRRLYTRCCRRVQVRVFRKATLLSDISLRCISFQYLCHAVRTNLYWMPLGSLLLMSRCARPLYLLFAASSRSIIRCPLYAEDMRTYGNSASISFSPLAALACTPLYCGRIGGQMFVIERLSCCRQVFRGAKVAKHWVALKGLEIIDRVLLTNNHQSTYGFKKNKHNNFFMVSKGSRVTWTSKREHNRRIY